MTKEMINKIAGDYVSYCTELEGYYPDDNGRHNCRLIHRNI